MVVKNAKNIFFLFFFFFSFFSSGKENYFKIVVEQSALKIYAHELLEVRYYLVYPPEMRGSFHYQITHYPRFPFAMKHLLLDKMGEIGEDRILLYQVALFPQKKINELLDDKLTTLKVKIQRFSSEPSSLESLPLRYYLRQQRVGPLVGDLHYKMKIKKEKKDIVDLTVTFQGTVNFQHLEMDFQEKKEHYLVLKKDSSTTFNERKKEKKIHFRLKLLSLHEKLKLTKDIIYFNKEKKQRVNLFLEEKINKKLRRHQEDFFPKKEQSSFEESRKEKASFIHQGKSPFSSLFSSSYHYSFFILAIILFLFHLVTYWPLPQWLRCYKIRRSIKRVFSSLEEEASVDLFHHLLGEEQDFNKEEKKKVEEFYKNLIAYHFSKNKKNKNFLKERKKIQLIFLKKRKT